jgi:hypothetical protein
MEAMENSTIVNGPELIKNNMPIQPENIMLILGVFALILLVGFGIFWIWSQLHK